MRPKYILTVKCLCEMAPFLEMITYNFEGWTCTKPNYTWDDLTIEAQASSSQEGFYLLPPQVSHQKFPLAEVNNQPDKRSVRRCISARTAQPTAGVGNHRQKVLTCKQTRYVAWDGPGARTQVPGCIVPSHNSNVHMKGTHSWSDKKSVGTGT